MHYDDLHEYCVVIGPSRRCDKTRECAIDIVVRVPGTYNRYGGIIILTPAPTRNCASPIHTHMRAHALQMISVIT